MMFNKDKKQLLTLIENQQTEIEQILKLVSIVSETQKIQGETIKIIRQILIKDDSVAKQ